MIRQSSLFATLAVLIISLVLISSSLAQDTLLISYQGRLNDDGGNPVTGTPSMMFTIYDGTGVSKWIESHPTVSVDNGLFSVVLGSQTALPDSVFTGDDRYLGITVGGDSEISPRTLLTSAPSAAYANHASIADSAVHIERGVGITQLINTGGVELVNGYLHFLAIDSINVPDSGYVMCQATMSLYCDHVTGTDARLNIEFRDTTLEHLLEQEFYWFLPPALPTDFYAMPASITYVFAVGPGYNKFHAIGSDFYDAGDTYYVGRIVMTMTYYPTSYGTVQVNATEPIGQDLPEKMALDAQLREELVQRSQRQSDERDYPKK